MSSPAKSNTSTRLTPRRSATRATLIDAAEGCDRLGDGAKKVDDDGVSGWRWSGVVKGLAKGVKLRGDNWRGGEIGVWRWNREGG